MIPLETGSRRIARAASVVMVGMALSSLTGLAATILISHAFGTSSLLDAFSAANRLTEILFNLMAGGALASAFVPTFTGFLARGDRSGAWHLASSIANLIFVALGAASLLAAVFAPWLVQHVLAPGFGDPAQIALTVRLLRVMLLSPVIFALSGLLMGILNAQQHFALPALAPACYRLGQIFGLVYLVPRWGILGLAWGVVLGSALHLLIQLPALVHYPGSYHLTLGLRDASTRLVGALMLPRLVGVGVVQLNFLVNTILASGMPEGSLAAITLAFALMIMPQAVLAQSTGIAALPTFSAQVARGELGAFRTAIADTLRGLVFLSLPASLGLVLLRGPIVALLLQGGAFTAESTQMVAWALLWYAAGLVGHSLLEIAARGFYALQDTRTPVAVGVAAMALNVVLSLSLAWAFQQWGWMPHGGLALANSLATALECTVLLALLHRRTGGLDVARLRPGLAASLGSTLTMGICLWVWLLLTRGLAPWIRGGPGVLLGALVYLLAAWVLKAPEARQLLLAGRRLWTTRASAAR
jgi:putative peptidoglycan lipid II flippase